MKFVWLVEDDITRMKKILFLTGAMEVRMNGSCAGGTGAFIDQMATLLSITPEELNTIAGQSQRSYSIASRCGVFAKSDIQALLNQGAQKDDIAASILTAVVNQTIAGLAQGREITGKVVYLGGPLTFLSQLRAAFDRILGVEGIYPENSLYYVAAGAALAGTGEELDLAEITDRIAHYSSSHHYQSSAALFHDQEEYQEFVQRHQKDSVPTDAPLLSDHIAYVGVDAGSTTVKAVAVNSQEEIIFSRYLPNSGNPVPLVRDFLTELYQKFPDIDIRSAASTAQMEITTGLTTEYLDMICSYPVTVFQGDKTTVLEDLDDLDAIGLKTLYTDELLKAVGEADPDKIVIVDDTALLGDPEGAYIVLGKDVYDVIGITEFHYPQ